MAQRTKSMLEAFQASRVHSPGPTRASKDPGAAGSGGGAGEGTGRGRAAASPPAQAERSRSKGTPPDEAPPGGGRYAAVLSQLDRGPSVAEEVHALVVHQRLRWLVVAVMVAAAFFLGLAAGETRELVEVQAAESDSGRADLAPFQESGKTAGASASAKTAAKDAPASFADALYDPANQFTVIAITFNQGQDEQAWAAVDYLAGKGFRAQPVASGTKIPVLVEAAPTRAELDEIQAALRALPGPPPQNRPNEFASAYIVSIDNYLQR